MTVIAPGAEAPAVPGIALDDGPRLLFVYKVTCPVCKLAAPVAERIEKAYPGLISGVGQDPVEELEEFSGEFGMSFPSVPDLPPYDVSEAYSVRVVPTLVLVNDGRVDDVVESWDRDGYNRLAARLSQLSGSEPVTVSEAGDGLPSFRPG